MVGPLRVELRSVGLQPRELPGSPIPTSYLLLLPLKLVAPLGFEPRTSGF